MVENPENVQKVDLYDAWKLKQLEISEKINTLKKE
jgi:hypothetical protein